MKKGIIFFVILLALSVSGYCYVTYAYNPKNENYQEHHIFTMDKQAHFSYTDARIKRTLLTKEIKGSKENVYRAKDGFSYLVVTYELSNGTNKILEPSYFPKLSLVNQNGIIVPPNAIVQQSFIENAFPKIKSEENLLVSEKRKMVAIFEVNEQEYGALSWYVQGDTTKIMLK